MTVLNQTENLSVSELELFLETLTDPQSQEFGKAEAAKDVAANRLVLKFWGFPSIERYYYKKILKNDFSIDAFDFGCCITDNLIAYIKGYNAVAEREIKRKFGNKDLTNAFQQAVQRLPIELQQDYQ